MKIISFSDIHLENAKDLRAPLDSDADIMILSGDIVNMPAPEPLLAFLQGWEKPVLYVAGNHEYYNDNHPQHSMADEEQGFRRWLAEKLPNVTLLLDEAVTINGVHFFGGTMWTDYADADNTAMRAAEGRMHDYKLIYTAPGTLMTPEDTLPLHAAFKQKLLAWLAQPATGPRVVITHHAPALHPQSLYGDSPLIPAFNSLDMLPVIEQHQPDFWFYGHTHECDRQKIGRTQLVSNQLGYQGRSGFYECEDTFDAAGAPVTATTAASAARRAAG